MSDQASGRSHGGDGQRHDRISDHARAGFAHDHDGALEGTSLDEEVTISQKMLSAVSGSILTSLLGTRSRVFVEIPAPDKQQLPLWTSCASGYSRRRPHHKRLSRQAD